MISRDALIERLGEIEELDVPPYESFVLQMCAAVEKAIQDEGHLGSDPLAGALLRIIRVAKEAA